MPVFQHCPGPADHRNKLIDTQWGFNAMVARPVARAEATTDERAIKALAKEWATIHEKVWDVWKVREKADVMREAKRSGTTVQFGRVHGICVEKNAELPEGHPNRKFKGRVVFLGNRVVNQDYESATFADLGNAPANLESGRLADCYGAVPGHGSEVADAVQAYLQSLMLGDPCWVELAAESRPGNIWGPQQYSKKDIDKLTKMWSQLRQPVVQLEQALYGHPDSVTWWSNFAISR